MINEIEVGVIYEGKVTGITKFGAFISLPGGKSGLVHISEIAYSYVSEVSAHLTEGQDVKVKVIGIDENKRINLSIKRALPPPPRPAAPRGNGVPPRAPGERPAPRPNGNHPPHAPQNPPAPERSRAPRPQPSAPVKENKNFDDMLKQFMTDSDSKLSGRYTEKSTRRRNNGGGRR